MDDLKFGYFSSLKFSESFIGGVMITNTASIPLEFKYTDAIKPTKIHRIIFGKVLEKYINEEVIRKTLFKDIKNTPHLYLVNDSNLLTDSMIFKVPLILIQNTTFQKLNSINEFQKVKEKEFLIQPKTSNNPLKLMFYTADPQIQEMVFNNLKLVINKIDVYEPFFRIEEALKTICQTRD